MKKNLLSIVFVFSLITLMFSGDFSAKEHHPSWFPAHWDTTTIYDMNYCSGGTNTSNRARLNYGFKNNPKGYDDIYSDATNACTRDNYYEVKAKTKDGGGNRSYGHWAKKGKTSSTLNAALRGTDYASWEIKT